MIQDGISIDSGIATTKNVVELDIENMFVAGSGIPSSLEGDIHHVRGLGGDAVNAVGGLFIAGAPIHAVIDRVRRIDHLGAIEKIG